LSHESSILFPVYLVCISLMAAKKPDKKKLLGLIGALFLTSFGYYFFRARFLNFDASVFPVVTWQQYGQHLPPFFYYIFRCVEQVVFPRDICLVTAIDPASSSGVRGILYIFLVLGSLLLVLIGFRKNKVILFSLAWFSAGVLPLFNMMFARPEMGLVMQVNRLYFCSIGLLIILSWCLVALMKFLRKGLRFFLPAAFLFSYISADLINNAFWKDELTYCSRWLQLVPRNPYALCSLGLFYGNKGDYKKANEYFWRGVDCFKKREAGRLTQELMPGSLLGVLYNNLAVNSDREGHIDEAIAYAQSAVLVDGNNSDGYFILGRLYARKDDLEKAIFYYNESIRTNIYRWDAHRELAFFYFSKGDKNRALEEVRAAVRIDPRCFDAL
jgi:tetratricopeptide (TPR) repeat protein